MAKFDKRKKGLRPYFGHSLPILACPISAPTRERERISREEERKNKREGREKERKGRKEEEKSYLELAKLILVFLEDIKVSF